MEEREEGSLEHERGTRIAVHHTLESFQRICLPVCLPGMVPRCSIRFQRTRHALNASLGGTAHMQSSIAWGKRSKSRASTSFATPASGQVLRPFVTGKYM